MNFPSTFSFFSNFQGRPWCYVEQGRYSTCYDKISSRRFTAEYYSSRACNTPHKYSYQCRGYNNNNYNDLGGNQIYEEPYYRSRYRSRSRSGSWRLGK